MTDNNLFIGHHGEILAITGYGLQARRVLKPLRERGVNIKLYQEEDYIPPEYRIEDKYWIQWIAESQDMPDPDIHIHYCLPPLARMNPNWKNILWSMWETTKYPNEWVPAINASTAFFAGCKALEKSAKDAGIKVPIMHVTPPIDTDMWCPEGEKIALEGATKDQVMFMYVANWIPRKNFWDLMTAFCCEFTGQKDVVLVIKTWGGDNSVGFKNMVGDQTKRHLHSLHDIDRPKVLLINDVMDESQLVKLMRTCDVYCSASYGEGFDLPMIQAMSLEKTIVATPFLSHGDYLNEHNSILTKYSLMPVQGAEVPNYHANQMWSRPDVKSFMGGLRAAYETVKEEDNRRGRAARKTVLEEYSAEKRINHLIEQIGKVAEL